VPASRNDELMLSLSSSQQNITNFYTCGV